MLKNGHSFCSFYLPPYSSKMRSIFIAAAMMAGVVTASNVPSTPVWPNEFQMTFNETLSYPILGSHHTTGTYYYSYTHKAERVDRANGHYDRYCGSNGAKIVSNTPCNQYVINGSRYLDYPDKNECCYCCSSAQGCGILRPDWLNNATYQGYLEKDGYNVTKWAKGGVQSNYYYERSSDRVMIEIDQVPNDDQIFDPTTYTTKVDPSVFQPPSRCTPDNKCSYLSICRHLGGY